MKQIVVINGGPGVGKDTFVNMVGEVVKVMNISSVDPVCKALDTLGWNKTKTDDVRNFMAYIKETSDKLFNTSFKYIDECIKKFNESDAKILFVHIREPEKIQRLKTVYDAKTLRVINLNVKTTATNTSDRNIHTFKYDIVINNTSDLNALRSKAYRFVKDLEGK